MRFRKITAVLLALILVMAMSVTAFAKEIYDGAADLKSGFKGKADYVGYQDEIPDNSSGRLTKAGGPDVFWSESSAASGLRIYNLVNSWDAIDILLGGLDGEYTLVVEFSAAGSKTFGIVDADSPYGQLATADGSSVKIEYKFTAKNGKAEQQNRFRLANLSDRDDYYVHSIKLYDAGGIPAGSSPKTGDSNMLVLSFGVLVLSAAGILVLRRKKAGAN